MPRIAIFAALQWECAPIARRLRNARRSAVNGCTIWRGDSARGEVWLVKTGIGLNQAHAAAQVAVDAAEFDLFLSTGCAGALASDLRPGDMTIASSIVSMASSQPLTTDVARSAEAVGVAERAGVRTRTGAVLCSPSVLATVSAKQAAAARYGTVAVEMEGEQLALCAANAGIPFVSARTILDTADTELKHSGHFIDPHTGNLRPLALAGYLARHPSAIVDLRGMQKMMQAAQSGLERFFAAWLSGNA